MLFMIRGAEFTDNGSGAYHKCCEMPESVYHLSAIVGNGHPIGPE